MKKGGYRKAVAGFSITETLIVLAVTGAILISAVIAIGGRVNRTQFTTGSNDLKTALQQVLNETANGYFPNSGNFTCTPGSVSNVMPTISTLSNQQQGTNGGCVFLGKAVQFGLTDNKDTFLTYAIAGNRLQAGTNTEVTTLAQAAPALVTPVTVSNPLEYGLTPAKIQYKTGSLTADTGGFAVLSSLGSYTDSASNKCDSKLCTGAQKFSLYALPTSTALSAGLNSTGFTTIMSTTSAGYGINTYTNYTAADSVTLCFNSGSTNQSATYTLGDSGTSFQSVTMKIASGSCS